MLAFPGSRCIQALLLALLDLFWPGCTAHSLSKDEALQLLGIDDSASEVEIRRAYRIHARQVHPDRCSRQADDCQQRFIELNDALQVLLQDQNEFEWWNENMRPGFAEVDFAWHARLDWRRPQIQAMICACLAALFNLRAPD
eukprot:gnl/MRDRNA2_/MRDRNA2_45584_c0_seq1.p1 gnl/MRDRNA2_/MRDRNA2_45584_c0~~gnl/MRDRNA2_/MRDRNA2_45584_c0_seq1.p1  ORF type:complete len:142 (+),score=30.46 gnl/MRDRNA2_/MRDRNA2_45584_c0_seq1:102-527(+)